ncbi:SusC/RagA family TonB-linked outer membrane protein [Bacteroides sedimenti]|uniref:SusC/RagA family TonB-linked outer membrane protein n=2 Tax=Bacteroides sedimenti TaxID=2136147 RepID=A0ABM8ICZ9_9BACE
MAQKQTVTGQVFDETNEPVLGASISEVGNPRNGTVTDLDGKFSLSLNPQGEISVSYIGYEKLIVSVKGQKSLVIKLKPTSTMLDEIVVTGYTGTQLRSKATNSIAKVSNEKLSTGVFSNPAQALSGAVSGLRVIQTSGNPGATPSIVLRGGTNLDGSGAPIVIVDGQIRSSLSDINPEDIEDMQVMKDAGATAIYGARANNGVILVTTKKGKAGTSDISVKAKVGINYLNTPYEFNNAADYLYWMRTAYARASNVWQKTDGTPMGYQNTSSLANAVPYGTGNKYDVDANGNAILNNNTIWSTMYLDDSNKFLLDKGWKTMKDPVTGKDLIFTDTDVAKYNLNNPSLTQDYNINMSGGNDKGHYYAGFGYNHSEGLPIASYYDRYSFIFNGDYKIRTWLTSTSSLNYNRANWQSMPGSQTDEYNYFGRIMSLPPTVRFMDENGNPMLGVNSGDGNQSYQANKFFRDNQTDKFTMSQSFKIDFMKGLYLKTSANWYYSEGMYESFNKDYRSTPTNVVSTRSSSASYDRTFDQTYNAVLNFERQFGNHYVTTMLGSEYYDSYSRGLSASGQGAATDDFMDLALTSIKENMRKIDSYHNRQRILSFFGRANYDYDSKYLVSFVIRKDGYSKLINNRWGVFPGVSTGWIFTKENFMKKFADIISFGKVRASYGLNGNVSGIGNYELQGSFKSNGNAAFYNGLADFSMSEVPNPGLRWEKSKTFEFGLDLSYLNNRYSTNFTFYNRLTSDKLARVNLASSSGISSILTNNGAIRNRGVEIELAAKPIQSKDWNWNINANISYNKNIIEKLPNNGLEKNRQNAYQVYTGNGTDKVWVGGYQEGQEPGVLYAFKSEGIYKSWDEIPDVMEDRAGGSSARVLYGKTSWANLTDAQKAGKVLPIQPGDVKWKDVNGDGVIDQYDMVKVGNTTPHWIGGLTSTLKWKNLSLFAALDYALDFTIYDNTTPWFLGAMQGTYNMTTDVKNTWSETNPNGTLPKYYWADQLGKSNYYRTSTMFAYSGSYVAFREISLTYSLPKSIISKAKLERLDLSVTGQNLGYLTQCKKVTTPEAGTGSGSGYGLPRTLLFGVNLSF